MIKTPVPPVLVGGLQEMFTVVVPAILAVITFNGGVGTTAASIVTD